MTYKDVAMIDAIPAGHLIAVHFSSGQISMGIKLDHADYLYKKIEWMIPSESNEWVSGRHIRVDRSTIENRTVPLVDVVDHGKYEGEA